MKTPKFLFTLHWDLVERMFDGRGMRKRDRIALAIVRRAIDWFLMRQYRSNEERSGDCSQS